MESLELRLAPAVPAAADGTIIFSAAAPLGRAFQTRYLHSVQLSPVEDEYRIQEGRIWSWREKVMSHNAGLPTHPLPRGRYVSEPPWMIMEGGGASWPEIFVRIGDARFGNNEIYGSGIPPIALWRLFPGQRVRLGVTACPLLSLLIHQAP